MSNQDLSILVNNRPIDTYSHKGKAYIEGWKGSEYSIQYKNNSNLRRKIVVSVDGLNVVSGDNNWERGYVVEPWQTLVIPGWRNDSENVAKFVFSSVKGSYNQHNDKGNVMNVGVIGCRVFVELQKTEPVKYNPIHYHYHTTYDYKPPIYSNPGYWFQTPIWTNVIGTNLSGGGVSCGTTFNSPLRSVGQNSVQCSFTCDSSPTMSENITEVGAAFLNSSFGEMDAKPQSVGTGWGENKVFETKTVDYEFSKSPIETITIFYDSREGLRRRGIPMDKPQQSYHEPNPFPDGCPPPTP